jgi:hypothetical protein
MYVSYVSVNQKGAASAAPFFLLIAAAALLAEQEGNAPQSGKTDDSVNNTTENCVLTAKDPGNQIELENTDQTPVNTADDRQDQRQNIQHLLTLRFKSLDGVRIPGFAESILSH